jgi:hypothetical protein
MSPGDPLANKVRAAVQDILDAEGDGFMAAQFVICMGLERFDAAGRIESMPWIWAPAEQAEWMTNGLLESALDLYAGAPAIEED